MRVYTFPQQQILLLFSTDLSGQRLVARAIRGTTRVPGTVLL